MELWTLGIRTSTLYFGEQGRSTVLDLKPLSTLRDAVGVLLLSKFYALSTASVDSLSMLGSGAATLVSFYAKQILSGDTAFAGKPLPPAMNVDAFKKALVYWGRKSNVSEAQLLKLGLDTNSIRSVGGALVRAIDISGREILTQTAFVAGRHALQLPTTHAMVFVQVRTGMSTTTFPLEPAP